jgi:hypothetical protein
MGKVSKTRLAQNARRFRITVGIAFSPVLHLCKCSGWCIPQLPWVYKVLVTGFYLNLLGLWVPIANEIKLSWWHERNKPYSSTLKKLSVCL